MSEKREGTFEPEQPMQPLDLKDSLYIEGRTNIRELKNNPDKVVREEPVINNSVDESILHYSDIKMMFEKMKNNYGISSPDIDIVVGKNKEEEDCVFLVVDKIEGENLEDLQSLPEDKKENFEAFYVSLLQSMFDSYKNGETFFGDFTPKNIMYGHRAKEKDAVNEFFLVDVGNGAFNYKEKYIIGGGEFGYDNAEYEYNVDFLTTLSTTIQEKEIEKYEKKFNGKAVLGPIRNKIKEIYEYLKANKGDLLKEFSLSAKDIESFLLKNK